MLLNRYELRGVIGQGNYGQVYEGFDHQTKKQVAIKGLFPQVVSNPDLMRITRTEIETLTAIDNPYIIKLIDHGPAGGLYYMVYEFCERGDLKANVDRRQKLTEDDALRVVYQMSEALCELQRRKIIHRDIKPENIFLTGDTCKLGDFGLCYIGERVQLNASVGSLGFLAPETQKDLVYSSKADVYSLGICFYEMIHGDIPFNQNQINDLYNIKMNLKITRKPGVNVSDFALDLLKRMVDPNESTRITCTEVRKLLGPMFASYRVPSPIKQGRSSTLDISPSKVIDRKSQEFQEKPPTRSTSRLQGATSCAHLYSDEKLLPNQRGNILDRFGTDSKNQNKNYTNSNLNPVESSGIQVSTYQRDPGSNSNVKNRYSLNKSQQIPSDVLPKLQMALESSKQLKEEMNRGTRINPSLPQTGTTISYPNLPQTDSDIVVQSRPSYVTPTKINSFINYDHQNNTQSISQKYQVNGQNQAEVNPSRPPGSGSFVNNSPALPYQYQAQALKHSSTVSNFVNLSIEPAAPIHIPRSLSVSPSMPSYPYVAPKEPLQIDHVSLVQQPSLTSVNSRQPLITSLDSTNQGQKNVSSIIDSYRIAPNQIAPAYSTPAAAYYGASRQPIHTDTYNPANQYEQQMPRFIERPKFAEPNYAFGQEYGVPQNRHEVQSKTSRPSILNQRLNLIANDKSRDIGNPADVRKDRDRSFSQAPKQSNNRPDEEGTSPTFGRALQNARNRAEENKKLASLDIFSRNSRGNGLLGTSSIKNSLIIRPGFVPFQGDTVRDDPFESKSPEGKLSSNRFSTEPSQEYNGNDFAVMGRASLPLSSISPYRNDQTNGTNQMNSLLKNHNTMSSADLMQNKTIKNSFIEEIKPSYPSFNSPLQYTYGSYSRKNITPVKERTDNIERTTSISLVRPYSGHVEPTNSQARHTNHGSFVGSRQYSNYEPYRPQNLTQSVLSHPYSHTNQDSFASNLINKYIGDGPSMSAKKGSNSGILMTGLLSKPRQIERNDRIGLSASGIYSLINKNN